MNRLLWSISTTYTNKRYAYLIAFAISILLLYFAPYYCYKNTTYGLFLNWLDFEESLYSIQIHGYPTVSELVAFNVCPLILFILALVGIGLSVKIRPMFWFSAPFYICAIVMSARELNHIDINGTNHIYISDIYSIFYIIFVILILCTITLITIALYTPSKEPIPRKPREHKPTDKERIAELERQVAELQKGKDAE